MPELTKEAALELRSEFVRSMIGELWCDRIRPPVFSRGWIRSWGRRLMASPELLRQWRIQSSLRRRGTAIGEACFVADRSGFTGAPSLLSIGEGSFIGRVKIGIHASVCIGSHVCINDDTELLTASHDVASPTWETITAPIVIEDHAWIAKRCIILPGVTVGMGAVVGAGAVVSKDVSPYSIVVGNPARPIKRQRNPALDYSPVDHVALIRAWKSA